MFQGNLPLPLFRVEEISILMMEAAGSSKTLVNFYKAVW
jgi:hypothetical protein